MVRSAGGLTFMRSLRQSALGRYALAVAIALLMAAVRRWLDPVIGVAVAPYLFGVLGVAAAAWFGGLGPGLVTSFTFAFLIVAFHVAPAAGGWGQLALPQMLRASAYIVQCAVISIIIDRLVQARRDGLVHNIHQQLRLDMRRRIAEAQSEGQAMNGGVRHAPGSPRGNLRCRMEPRPEPTARGGQRHRCRIRCNGGVRVRERTRRWPAPWRGAQRDGAPCADRRSACGRIGCPGPRPWNQRAGHSPDCPERTGRPPRPTS